MQNEEGSDALICNATLVRVDAPPTAGPGGDVAAYVPGSGASLPSAGVRCCLDEPTFVLQRVIDQLKLGSTAVLYVPIANLASAATVLLRNCQVLVTLDGQASQTFRIDMARVMVNGAVSHVQCFLRAA